MYNSVKLSFILVLETSPVSPLFIISGPELVIAQCKAGIVGSFPALNARPQSQLDEWLHQITEELAAHNRDNPDSPAAPYAVNQIVHRTNNRLEEDMVTCAKWKVPMLITSLGAREDLNKAAHEWGGITMHDVISDRFARKAIEKGAETIKFIIPNNKVSISELINKITF